MVTPGMVAISTREEVEVRMGQVLRKGLPYLKAIIPYHGEINTKEGLEQMRAKVAGRTPSVLISAMEGADKPVDMRGLRFEETIEFDVIILAANQRSRADDAVVGDVARRSTERGAWQVVEDATGLLVGANLRLDGFGRLRRKGTRVMHQSPGFAVWVMTFEGKADWAYQREEDRAAELLEQIVGHIRIPEDEAVLLESTVSDGSLTSDDVGGMVLLDADGVFTEQLIGMELKVTGAAVPENNGSFLITGVPSSTQLAYAHPPGRSESPLTATYQIRVPGTSLEVDVEQEEN
jgi:hypothetical protein